MEKLIEELEAWAKNVGLQNEPEIEDLNAAYRAFKKILSRAKLRLNATESVAERPKIVCLCGSTRFMREFFEVGWDFTLKGYIVLSVGVCKTSDKDGAHGAEALGQDVADRLDELHLRKIDMADEVYVLNVDGYIGKSTRKEIDYAIRIGKPMAYLEALPDVRGEK